MAYTPCLTRETHNSISSGNNNNNHSKLDGKLHTTRRLTTSTEIVLITTEEAAAAPLVSFRMFAAGVVHQPTQHLTVPKESNNNKAVQHLPRSQILQLVEETYIPPTPLKHNQLSKLLRKYPDSNRVDYVIQGLKHGFSLEYTGQYKFRAPENLPMAKLDPQLIRDQLRKEIALGRMLGPFNIPPFPDLMCLPVGLVPKKDSDEMRMIMHLRYPYGQSINDFIDPEKASTCYQTFDNVVQLVIRQGRFCWLSKGDIKSAFRVAPICFKDIKCLGIYFEEQYFVDLALPFGSAISCAIFEDIATLIHWIFEQRMSICFIHYLDDYLWVHKHFIVCLRAGQAVKQVAQEIGPPLAEDKFFGPVQVLEFLGLTIDSIHMVLAIPSDKATSILQDIQVVIKSKKCLVKQLQALARQLNYDMFAGMKPHWHVSITVELRKDLQMWSRFIQEYGGWTPILLPEMPVIHLFTDAATTETLGWGAWWGTAWAWNTWDPVFMCSSKFSIDSLISWNCLQ